MGILEGLNEVVEMAEAIENIENNEQLFGQMNELQDKLNDAIETNNTEKANYFRGELARIGEQLAGSVGESNGEISFGSGHSPKYYYEKAGKEKAQHGESPLYKSYIKQAGEAEAAKVMEKHH